MQLQYNRLNNPMSMQYLADMLLGVAGIEDDGCRGCKIAWYHPVDLTQAAGRGEILANDQGVNPFFSRIDMKTV
jgi:hypothetical protein